MTVSPDVSVSTNLGGWINKVGVFGPAEEPDYEGPEATALSWRVSPSGRHVELGISEMNLFLALGQLGLTRELFGEQLFPIGTLYDPFVVRGLEAFLYGVYSGSRFVVLGTPSGISLSREGGAHQSTITPGIGMELPGVLYAEPTYAREVEWILLDELRRMQEPEGESLYLRLSTKPVDQAPFAALVRAARGGGRASRRARGRPLAARGRAGRRLRGARHLRGDRARGSARRRAARGGRGRRRRRALHLVPRPALPRLAPQSPDASRRPDRDAQRVPPRASVAAGAARPPASSR